MRKPGGGLQHDSHHLGLVPRRSRLGFPRRSILGRHLAAEILPPSSSLGFLQHFAGVLRRILAVAGLVYATVGSAAALLDASPAPVLTQPPLDYQYILPPEDLEPGEFYGIALANPSSGTATLTVERVSFDTGMPTASRTLQLAPGNQYAQLTADLWPEPSPHPAWIRVRSDRDDLVVFAQLGDWALSRLDGVTAARRPLQRLLLLPVLAGAQTFHQQTLSSRIHLLNPGTQSTRVRVSLVQTSQPTQSQELTLAAGGGLTLEWGETRAGNRVAGVGPRDRSGQNQGPVGAAGYCRVEVLSGSGITGFLDTRTTGTRIMLAAAEPTTATELYSPQFVHLPGTLFSLLSLVNDSDRPIVLIAETLDDDGQHAAPAVELTLAAHEYRQVEAAELFTFPPQGLLGTLRLRLTQGTGLAGSVIFGRNTLQYAAALTLSDQLHSRARFAHVASLPDRFFTGLALFNPGPATAQVRLAVLSHSGTEVATGLLELEPGHRLSRTLTELAGEMELLGGSIVVSASAPVAAQELFGTQNQSLLSAVPAVPDTAFPTCRRAELWPFRQNSIWNLPLGTEARLVPAGISAPTAMGLTADEDILILTPEAPLKAVWRNTAGWDRNRTRCGTVTAEKVYPDPVPVPDDFRTDPGYLGLTPNMSGAILMPDGVTLRQTQPLHVCGFGGTVTSQYTFPDDHLRQGDGIRGGHGGSGMSSLGGTLRLGELVPGGVIRHALKVNLFAHKYLQYRSGDPTPGYRWPAVRADGYAAQPNHPCSYGGQVPEVEMGALLALKPDFDLDRLHTEPARILARALMNYGAYVVDDTCWDVFAITTEWSPRGRVVEEFQSVWGWSFETSRVSTCKEADAECRWAKDIAEILTALHVVDDNEPAVPGGKGPRRQPAAPDFCAPK